MKRVMPILLTVFVFLLKMGGAVVESNLD
ncbi:uncharacterized protein METZ01_LOCUS393051 [marine metagenome]|uniref:Uncharacterized protein n=1 Tax=marine metagenome TaxID=408172 RepID=A0A382V1A6_9ZZZZ